MASQTGLFVLHKSWYNKQLIKLRQTAPALPSLKGSSAPYIR
jgi:hypothetical protein